MLCGDKLPPEEIDMKGLEAKWQHSERVRQVKEKLRLRRQKRETKENERMRILAKVLNLREVDCCGTCSNNHAYGIDYVNCDILRYEATNVFGLCDRFKA